MNRSMEPTPEQLGEWWAAALRTVGCDASDAAIHVARLAYAAGGDAELEACCARQCLLYGRSCADDLRAARRPKPPTLKQQALGILPSPGGIAMKYTFNPDDIELIRRAIEALPEEAD